MAEPRFHGIPRIETREYSDKTLYSVIIKRSPGAEHIAKMQRVFFDWFEVSGVELESIVYSFTMVQEGNITGRNAIRHEMTWTAVFPQFSHAMMFMLRWADEG